MLYKNNFIHSEKLYGEFEKKMYVRNLNVSSLFITFLRVFITHDFVIKNCYGNNGMAQKTIGASK